MPDAHAKHGVGGEGGNALTADAIAVLVHGEVLGDGFALTSSIAPLDRAAADQLSFCGSAKYGALMATSAAGVVLVSAQTAQLPSPAAARIVVDDPHDALLALIPRFYRLPARTAGVHPSAVIGSGVTMGEAPSIGAHVVLEPGVAMGDRVTIDANTVVGSGARIGDDVHVYPGVTIYPNVRLGNRVIVHAGVRLGSDGFGYVYRDGAHQKLQHVGGCVLEDDVEVGANTTIDRGSIDDTVVGAGTKIDNLVQIGHNVRIGRLCLIMAHVGISGSAHIEDGCILAGQVGVAGHITIAKGARIAGQSGVFGDVPAGATWSGHPARPHRDALRAQAALYKVAGLMRRIERMLQRSEDEA